VGVFETGFAAQDDVSADVTMYCLGSILAEQAHRSNRGDFGKLMESALAGLLEAMPRTSQSRALRLSYELSVAEEPLPVQRPKPRLVYSRPCA
jgi:hypothetical protein